MRMASTLQVQGGYPSHGEFISSFQRDKEEAECPSCTSCFLSSFNSNWPICQRGIFWGSLSWAPSWVRGTRKPPAPFYFVPDQMNDKTKHKRLRFCSPVCTWFSHSGCLESVSMKNYFRSQITSDNKLVAVVIFLKSTMEWLICSLQMTITLTIKKNKNNKNPESDSLYEKLKKKSFSHYDFWWYILVCDCSSFWQFTTSSSQKEK